MLDLQSYLRGKGRNVPLKKGRLDLTSYMLGKAASGGGIQEITGTLPLTVRSRASQILKNYRIYGTASGAGVETENLWDGKVSSLTLRQVLSDGTKKAAFVISKPGVYTVKCFNDHSGYIYCKKYTISTDTYEAASPLSLPSTDSHPRVTVTAIVDADNIFLVYDPLRGNLPEAANQFNLSKLCVVESSTAPSSYIPYGYKLPLKVTANGTTTDYPVYIGDSQLGEEEYVDYEEQKIYKLVDGTLTPTDPPVPLPDITLPQGEVIIDTEEEVKPQATVKGKITQIT